MQQNHTIQLSLLGYISAKFNEALVKTVGDRRTKLSYLFCLKQRQRITSDNGDTP